MTDKPKETEPALLAASQARKKDIDKRRADAGWAGRYLPAGVEHIPGPRCEICRHYDSRVTHRFCTLGEFLTEKNAVCREYQGETQ